MPAEEILMSVTCEYQEETCEGPGIIDCRETGGLWLTAFVLLPICYQAHYGHGLGLLRAVTARR